MKGCVSDRCDAPAAGVIGGRRGLAPARPPAAWRERVVTAHSTTAAAAAHCLSSLRRPLLHHFSLNPSRQPSVVVVCVSPPSATLPPPPPPPTAHSFFITPSFCHLLFCCCSCCCRRPPTRRCGPSVSPLRSTHPHLIRRRRAFASGQATPDTVRHVVVPSQKGSHRCYSGL